MTKTRSIDEISEDFAADFASLKNDVARLSHSISELVKGQASATSSTVFGAMDDARGRVQDTAFDAHDRVKAASAELEATIERNPLTAVLVAMVAGLMIGMMSRPRH